MIKIYFFTALFMAFIVYSAFVYTSGTNSSIIYSKAAQEEIDHGKRLFQQYNCIACHQVYGLGGYLGPELTTAYSDKDRGETYMKVFLKTGGSRMPDFHFSDDEITALTSYLKYIDSTA